MKQNIIFLLIFSVCLNLVGCDAKDRCLDQGGSYNEATGKCEK
ncbi:MULTISPECIES: hypothetical protein [Neisseria]|nr:MULTISPECIES: hypothetical protein [Neisseria]